MQIVVSENITALPHDKFGKGVMQDVQALYGGAISQRGNFQTPDGAVKAAVHKGETLVTVQGLGLQPNAARWTAAKAFEAKGGVALGHLATEVPGLVAANEWRGRRRQADDVIVAAVRAEFADREEALINDMSLSDAEFDRRSAALTKEHDTERERRVTEARSGFYVVTGIGTENDPGEVFFRGTMHHAEQTLGATSPQAFLGAQAASEGFHAAFEENGPRYENTPHTHSVFVAEADDLLVAATRMSAEYDALAFHVDDPGVTVARALGAQSLDHLAETWQGAMSQDTPLAAGQFVMRALAQ